MAIIISFLVVRSGFRSTHSLWSCKAWAKPSLYTVADDDVVIIEACPHHHARRDIQTRVRSIVSDAARCCEAQAAAVPNVVSTTFQDEGQISEVEF